MILASQQEFYINEMEFLKAIFISLFWQPKRILYNLIIIISYILFYFIPAFLKHM